MPGPPAPGVAGTSPAGAFASQVAKLTGLNLDVVLAWVGAEGGAAASNNFLNLRGYGKSWSGAPVAGASSGGFTAFPTVGAAATETAWWINHMTNYAGIRSSSSSSPSAQLAAIAKSPWDAGHYGGNGQNLAGQYGKVTGSGFNVGAWLSGIGSGVSHAVSSLNPATAAGHAVDAALGGVASSLGDALLRGALFLVLLALGAGLIYEGLRRMSGGAAPSIGQALQRAPQFAEMAAA